MRLALIPARGGSKRIPRKNVVPFCGKPIIGWSIEAALASGCFDEVVVSTDDDEIAEVAQQLGARVPFRRPPALADDYTPTIPVVCHAIEWFTAQAQTPDQVCCLYATAPFVTTEDLRHGLQMLEDSAADYVFPVTDYGFPIQRALRLTDSSRLEMLQPEHWNTRSQDLEHAYHDAGQFYWGRTAAWLSHTPIFGPGSAAMVTPRHRVQDIDTPDDWKRAEWLFRAQRAMAPDAPA